MTISVSYDRIANVSENLPDNVVSPQAIEKATDVIKLLMKESLTADEVAEKTGLSLMEVAKIYTHPDFLRKFSSLRRDVAKVEFDSTVHKRLQQIVRDGDEKNVASAVRAWGEVLGNVEGKKLTVKHEGTLASIAKALEAEGVVIEADYEDVDATEER